MYCDCVIKIFVGFNATTQEVFSTCIKPLSVFFGVVWMPVGIDAAAQEVFSMTWNT